MLPRFFLDAREVQPSARRARRELDRTRPERAVVFPEARGAKGRNQQRSAEHAESERRAPEPPQKQAGRALELESEPHGAPAPKQTTAQDAHEEIAIGKLV